MSVDAATVKRIGRLARIRIEEDEVAGYQNELNAILGFVEQLGEVNVDGVEAMTSVTPMTLRRRDEDGRLIDSANYGRYLDVWEKRADGRWKIAERAYLTDFDVTGPVADALFQTTGKRDESDPSYRLFKEGRLLPID